MKIYDISQTAFFSVKEQKLNLKAFPIDTIRFGTGKKALIMIQGLNTNGIKGAGASLAWMYRIFAKDYTVYLFDRRPEISEGLTVREMAGDVAEAMDALGIRNADVLGVSQGGMIAEYLAIDRPELVNKLVLAVTLSKNNATVRAVIEKWIALTEQSDWKQLVADMAEKMYSASYLKRYRPMLPLLTVLQKPKDAGRFIRLAQSCLTCNAYEDLDKIQCPVFVIGGHQDKVVTGAASEEIVRKLNCESYLYEDLGHAAYEEAPDFNQKVYDFLMK